MNRQPHRPHARKAVYYAVVAWLLLITSVASFLVISYAGILVVMALGPIAVALALASLYNAVRTVQQTPVDMLGGLLGIVLSGPIVAGLIYMIAAA